MLLLCDIASSFAPLRELLRSFEEFLAKAQRKTQSRKRNSEIESDPLPYRNTAVRPRISQPLEVLRHPVPAYRCERQHQPDAGLLAR